MKSNKSKRTRKLAAKPRTPCPKVPRRYTPAPGEFYRCDLPFIGQTVRIEGRTAAQSIVGEAMGCVKGPKGKPSRVVIGRGTSRARVAGWLRAERRAKFGPGAPEAPRLQYEVIPPAPTVPRQIARRTPDIVGMFGHRDPPRFESPLLVGAMDPRDVRPTRAPHHPLLLDAMAPRPARTAHHVLLALPAPAPAMQGAPWAMPRLPGYMTHPASRAPEPVGPPVPKPTSFQKQMVVDILRDFYVVRFGNYRAGVLPVALDMHPDGRLRVVIETLAMPDGFAGPKDKPLTPGKRYQIVVDPEKTPDRKTEGGVMMSMGRSRTHALDADPAWRTIKVVRVLPSEGAMARPPFSQTLDEALEKSRAKAPAKKREVSEEHWRHVASALHNGTRVAREVLADYPSLVEFFGPQVLAGPTRADIERAQTEADDEADPDITVHWSVARGLMLKTRGKESAIIAAIRRLKTDRIAYFKWSSPLQEYYRPQSVGVSESTTDIDRVVAALRRYGMRVRVERGAVTSLGEANARRAEHKLSRADNYASRADAALSEAEALRDAAAQMSANIPVGASSRKAERIMERAERREGASREEAEYAMHAASRAEGLAGTALTYDPTATITLREAEKRVDAFAELFTRKVKAATGAVRIPSSKRANRSEYQIRWNVVYPPSANLAAEVFFDGRLVEVRGKGRELFLSADVTHVDVPDVFAQVIAALPKVTSDLGAHVHDDPEVLATEMALYGKRRMAPFAKLFPPRTEIELWPPKASFASTGISPLQIRVQQRGAEASQWRHDEFTLAWPTPSKHPEFRLVHTQGSGHGFVRRGDEKTVATIELPLRGLTVADAWNLYAGHITAMVTGKPFVGARRATGTAPTRATVAHGVGGVEETGRAAARAGTAAKGRALSQRLAPTVARAQELARKPGEADARLAGLLADATAQGTGLGFFPTPPDFAREAVDLADVQPGMRVLEPSAGLGGMVEPLVAAGAVVTAVEASPARAAYLDAAWGSRGVTVVVGDFLDVPPSAFDRVVMNPPFAIGSKRHVDEAHVVHALRFVGPGGRLVAIMSGGSDRADSRPTLHRALAGWSVEWQRVEAGRFRISGTNVPVVILIADRNA